MMKKKFLTAILVILSSIGHAAKIVPLATSFKLNTGKSILIEGTGLTITLKSVGTAHAINDDVISDVRLVIRKNGSNEELFLETINGKSSEKSLGDYTIVLEFADGYHRVCGLKVVQSVDPAN